jgi:hypothetical protein
MASRAHLQWCGQLRSRHLLRCDRRAVAYAVGVKERMDECAWQVGGEATGHPGHFFRRLLSWRWVCRIVFKVAAATAVALGVAVTIGLGCKALYDPGYPGVAYQVIDLRR